MRWQRLIPIYLMLLLAGFAMAQTQSDRQKPDLATIVSRMEAAQQQNREATQAYTVTREYRLYGKTEQDPKSQVIAEISFVPPHEKTFTIEKAEGSDRGQKIVQHVLETEADAAKKDDNAPSSINDRNYEFSLLGEQSFRGHPCWVLGLKPKHETKDLLEGRAIVDQDTYLIQHVEGDLAKSPSWWLKKVHVAVDFGDVGGLWLQSGTRAVAEVRLAGTHIFTSHALSIRTAEQEARAATPSLLPAHSANVAVASSANRASSPAAAKSAAVKRRPIRPVPSMLGAGVLVPR